MGFGQNDDQGRILMAEKSAGAAGLIRSVMLIRVQTAWNEMHNFGYTLIVSDTDNNANVTI